MWLEKKVSPLTLVSSSQMLVCVYIDAAQLYWALPVKTNNPSNPSLFLHKEIPKEQMGFWIFSGSYH